MVVSAQQRRAIYDQAGGCCEYCRIAEGDRMVGFEIDHIIPLKHGGQDVDHNLCLACAPCNRYKGAEVAAIDFLTNEATRLYDPRQQKWSDHFHIHSDATLSGITSEGRATVSVLRMNLPARIEQRLDELQLGNYPCQPVR